MLYNLIRASITSESSYRSGVKRYVDFCTQHNLQWFTNSQEELTTRARYYIAYLSCEGLTGNTITGYLHAWNWLLAASNRPTLDTQNLAISILIRGATRLATASNGTSGTAPNRGPRTPLMPWHLLLLREKVNLEKQDQAELWWIIIAAWTGLMRLQDYTVPPGGAPTVLNKHLTMVKMQQHTVLRVEIPKSKTDQQRLGAVIFLGPTSDERLCPIRAFLRVRAFHQQPDAALFTNEYSRPLQRRQFEQHFQQLLVSCGLDGQRFSSHSLRRGGATTRFLAKHSPEQIRRQGRWASQSNTWQRYVDPSANDIALFQRSPIAMWSV